MAAAGDADRRLSPSPWSADYVHLRTLAVQLRRRAAECLADRRGLRLVDVGCGAKPYAAFFADSVTEHVGVDIAPGPCVDVIGAAEDLPFDDASFDVLLSTQSLQYVADPHRAAQEFARVLRPGGWAFVSTHGCSPFDGSPTDRWRWTRAGLQHLFGGAHGFDEPDVRPGGGVGSAVAWIGGWHLNGVAARLGVPALARPPIFAIQLVGWSADRAMQRLAPDRLPDASPNYLVVARRHHRPPAGDDVH